MTGRGYSRRGFLRDVVMVGGSTLVLGACTTTPSAQPGSVAGRSGKAMSGLPDIEGAELITDPARFPKTFREAPELAKLVAEGKLPPVAERVGSHPLVLKPLHSTGRYGGQIRRGFVGPGDFQNAACARACGGRTVIRSPRTTSCSGVRT
jgi:peptide/nickel transport system substrate-binding protein